MKQHPARQNAEPLTGDCSSPAISEVILEAMREVRAGIQVEDNFRIIAAQLSPRLLSYYRAYSSSREEAEDLVQKTLTRVFLGVKQLKEEEKFLAWLFAIARNVRRTAAEQRQRERQLVAGGVELAEELADPRTSPWPHDQELNKRLLDVMWAAIEKLPPKQRQCLLLQVRDELSYGEIAETLRLSVNTVRNHLAEAKKSLRRLVKSEFQEALQL
jgi:RNA polymerase sigma-70 factor (ECF subfamily)